MFLTLAFRTLLTIWVLFLIQQKESQVLFYARIGFYEFLITPFLNLQSAHTSTTFYFLLCFSCLKCWRTQWWDKKSLLSIPNAAARVASLLLVRAQKIMLFITFAEFAHVLSPHFSLSNQCTSFMQHSICVFNLQYKHLQIPQHRKHRINFGNNTIREELFPYFHVHRKLKLALFNLSNTFL